MEGTMKVCVLTGQRQLEWTEREIPQPAAGELQIKLEYVGICGSDLHFFDQGRLANWELDGPLALGHEPGGVVTAIGEGVTGFEVGDKVAIEPAVPCGKCEACRTGHYNLCPDVKMLAIPHERDGVFSESCTHDATMCYKLPENMDTMEGGLLEPLTVGMHGTELSDAKLGETAIVLGCGCIGLCTIMSLKARGVTEIYAAAVLTNIEAQNLFNSMHRLKEQGTAMVFITHHLDEVMEETDRITIMKDGQLVEEVPTSEITKEEMITKMAGKKVNVAKHVKRTYSNEKFFEAKNLTRTGEFENVSFDVKKGEILCVAGLVGAGRTEIFKCVFGITEKEPGGQTFIEGKEVNIKSPIEAIKYGMGYVSEERRHDGITPGMSVKENMILPSYGQMTKNGLIDYKKVTEIVDQYIDSMSIKTASRETLIKNLSGGNQQKVIVARWMAKNVKMLILDEPTRGIDVNAKGEIYDLIRTLADNGVAVVVISSEMEEVLALADRIMVIHAGRVSGFIDQVETTSQEDVLKVAFQ